MKKTIILFIFLLLSSAANANEKYEYCEIWGIAGGVNDSFIQNLVGRVLDKKKLLLDSACASVKKILTSLVRVMVKVSISLTPTQHDG